MFRGPIGRSTGCRDDARNVDRMTSATRGRLLCPGGVDQKNQKCDGLSRATLLVLPSSAASAQEGAVSPLACNPSKRLSTVHGRSAAHALVGRTMALEVCGSEVLQLEQIAEKPSRALSEDDSIRRHVFSRPARSIGEATTLIGTTNERWCEAEVNRTVGEIALNSPQPEAAKAEAYFERALAVARQQQAKSWEVRAAMSMARLWREQGKRTD